MSHTLTKSKDRGLRLKKVEKTIFDFLERPSIREVNPEEIEKELVKKCSMTEMEAKQKILELVANHRLLLTSKLWLASKKSRG